MAEVAWANKSDTDVLGIFFFKDHVCGALYPLNSVGFIGKRSDDPVRYL